MKGIIQHFVDVPGHRLGRHLRDGAVGGAPRSGLVNRLSTCQGLALEEIVEAVQNVFTFHHEDR